MRFVICMLHKKNIARFQDFLEMAPKHISILGLFMYLNCQENDKTRTFQVLLDGTSLRKSMLLSVLCLKFQMSRSSLQKKGLQLKRQTHSLLD